MPGSGDGNLRVIVGSRICSGARMKHLRLSILLMGVLAIAAAARAAEDSAAKASATLRVYVDGVNRQGGNIGVMIFRSDKGWPEHNDAAYKHVIVSAHPGTMVVEVPDLPLGEYAIAVGHDVNVNRKVDRNWLGKPTEQWGMSNNPHARFSAPDFAKAKFAVNGNEEIHIRMQ